MPLYNEVQSGRYNRLLQKLLMMKGGAPAPQLGGDIEPGITLESDRPEWGYLAGDMLASCPGLKAADVANLAGVGLANPASSGVLAVTDGILVNNENAATRSFNIYQGGLAVGSIARGRPRDFRWTTPTTKTTASGVGSSIEAVATGQLIGRLTLATGASIYLPLAFIVNPNRQLLIQTDIVNAICSVTFFWRERAQEESEI